MGTPLRPFHPRTFLETWEDALGWLLPSLAPLERGLHSVSAPLPACLLICMTVPLLRRYMAGSPVWGGTHLLGLWTHAANRLQRPGNCGVGVEPVSGWGCLASAEGALLSSLSMGPGALCPLPPPPGCALGLPSDTDLPGLVLGSSLFCIWRWVWVLPAGAAALLSTALSVLGGAADTGGRGQLERERGDPPHTRGLGKAGSPTAAGRPRCRCVQGAWKRVSWTVTRELWGHEERAQGQHPDAGLEPHLPMSVAPHQRFLAQMSGQTCLLTLGVRACGKARWA